MMTAPALHAGPERPPDAATDRLRAVASLALWMPVGILYALMSVWSYGRTPAAAALAAAAATLPAVGLAWAGERLSARTHWPDPGSARRAWGRHLVLHLALGYVLSTAWLGWLWLRLALDLGPAVATRFWAQWWPWQLHAGVWPMLLTAILGHAVRGTRRLRAQREIAARAERARVTAELGALRAHLSPHFLFNVLHALGGLVRTDPAAANAMLARLDALLGYVLRHASGGASGAPAHDAAAAADDAPLPALVPLSEEWTFAEAYLALERERLGDRLRWRADATAEALDRPVPPFVLQPLVENAVRHAVAPRLEGGTITLTAWCAPDGVLHLRVADDGPGATAAALTDGPGFGLRAVRERVAALGDASSCVVESPVGGGVVARLALPRPIAGAARDLEARTGAPRGTRPRSGRRGDRSRMRASA